jgi:hypothetical protein
MPQIISRNSRRGDEQQTAFKEYEIQVERQKKGDKQKNDYANLCVPRAMVEETNLH